MFSGSGTGVYFLVLRIISTGVWRGVRGVSWAYWLGAEVLRGCWGVAIVLPE